jgi:fido (protein-threonine AMPylation protein)
MSDNHPYLNFDEYIRKGEPSQKEKALNWETAIGLQAVDGLRVSDYLRETAQKHIEGEISSDDVKRRIKEYYQTKTKREPDDDGRQEADSVSSNIQEILATNTLDFSVRGYMALHRKIFDGVFKHAGQLRKCDISKKEWVLEWDTVDYLFWQDLHRALEYDIAKEREFSYKGISQDDLIKYIARFTSDLWQIHAFGEGNTRTTAVFIIQYLRSLGFEVTNDMFAKHSWYFRNALVRANYKSAVKGIDYSPIYLERFFRNLLLGEQWDLRNRYLHIHPSEEWSVQPNLAAPTSTEQVPNKYRISTGQVRDKLHTNNQNIIDLIKVVGEEEMSVKIMMNGIGLKGRDNFLNLYLNPAISEGYVRMLYPQSPRHPRQKYLLTAKGLSLYKDIVLS